MSLDRFLRAQDAIETGFNRAISELRAGRKTSHWIWYVFPQLLGLGRSSTARLYALRDLEEARQYACDPTLRRRLLVGLGLVAEQLRNGVPLNQLMGGDTDSLKLVSCVTLFEIVGRTVESGEFEDEFKVLVDTSSEILRIVEQQGFNPCTFTRATVAAPN